MNPEREPGIWVILEPCGRAYQVRGGLRARGGAREVVVAMPSLVLIVVASFFFFFVGNIKKHHMSVSHKKTPRIG